MDPSAGLVYPSTSMGKASGKCQIPNLLYWLHLESELLGVMRSGHQCPGQCLLFRRLP